MNEEQQPYVEKESKPSVNAVHSGNRWIIGLALLLIGGILLIRNLVGVQIDQWWFILLIIPSIAAFTTSWRRYRSFGRSQRKVVVRPMLLGFIFLLAAVIPLFNLSGHIIFPLLLIMAGVVALVVVLIF
jgi:hypothetical protein